MAGLEEPILPRLNRLDNILRQLEDIRSEHHSSPKSSYASTTSSGTQTSAGRSSFADHSPEKHCRPLDEVVMEVEHKGTLMERLVHAEDRILKLCLQLEGEVEGERSKELQTASAEKKAPKKGLKQLVKSCVGVKPKRKHNKP